MSDTRKHGVSVKVIREKKKELQHWQMIARQETRWLRETISKCEQLEKELQELYKQDAKK